MIRRTPMGYAVFSEKGKRLSRYYSHGESGKKQAEKRLAQIEYFKHKKGK